MQSLRTEEEMEELREKLENFQQENQIEIPFVEPNNVDIFEQLIDEVEN